MVSTLEGAKRFVNVYALMNVFGIRKEEITRIERYLLFATRVGRLCQHIQGREKGGEMFFKERTAKCMLQSAWKMENGTFNPKI